MGRRKSESKPMEGAFLWSTQGARANHVALVFEKAIKKTREAPLSSSSLNLSQVKDDFARTSL